MVFFWRKKAERIDNHERKINAGLVLESMNYVWPGAIRKPATTPAWHLIA